MYFLSISYLFYKSNASQLHKTDVPTTIKVNCKLILLTLIKIYKTYHRTDVPFLFERAPRSCLLREEGRVALFQRQNLSPSKLRVHVSVIVPRIDVLESRSSESLIFKRVGGPISVREDPTLQFKPDLAPLDQVKPNISPTPMSSNFKVLFRLLALCFKFLLCFVSRLMYVCPCLVTFSFQDHYLHVFSLRNFSFCALCFFFFTIQFHVFED